MGSANRQQRNSSDQLEGEESREVPDGITDGDASLLSVAEGAQLAPVDLRFGGEDISGMSEWTMRAHRFELDEGLSAGDYFRPDEEILEEAYAALSAHGVPDETIRMRVRGAVVSVEGSVPSRTQRVQVESWLLDVPGVKDVQNLLEIDRAQRL